MQEKILFDLDNAPQVSAAIPLAEELECRGHTVLFSVRNRSRAWGMMQLRNRPFLKYKDTRQASFLGKAASTILRAISLAGYIRKNKITRSVGLGSRALPIASHIAAIPTVTLIDYEWVNTYIYNKYSDIILLPEVITRDQCEKANINTDKVKYFPGIKQHIYIYEKPNSARLKKLLELNPDKINVLLRPPATTAHYHNPETDQLFKDTLNDLKNNTEIELYCFPRHKSGNIDSEVHSLNRLFNGIELISAFDAVVGAGGSMTREAAVLGIPSYTCFKGTRGKVDEFLIEENRLSEATRQIKLSLKTKPLLKSAENASGIIADCVLGVST